MSAQAECQSESDALFVIVRRNEMLNKAKGMNDVCDIIHIENWELRKAGGQFNVVFAFDEEWLIDDICVAVINIQEHCLSLHVFHDESMDELRFSLSSFSDEDFHAVYEKWIDNNVNFIAASLNKDGKEEFLMLPTKIIKK